MHHFIYPSKDTYITNRAGFADKNFGLNELLQVGTSNTPVKYLSQTKDYTYVSYSFNSQQVDNFNGYFSGSLSDTASFSGSLVGYTGCLTGTGSGVDSRNEQTYVTKTTQFTDRALLKFDLTAISQSIVSGAITNPQFHLKLKVCNEYNLPITYTIYAFPVSQSWNKGDGYSSDGGSYEGANWWYKDYDLVTPWFTPTVSTPKPSIDFINNPNLLTASFAYGGGTFYTSSAVQNFNYESADIDMDVTSIVNLWLSGNIPNEGFVIMSSDELNATGSGFLLTFYSQDTNTIYSPYLDAAWSDFSFVTGSTVTSSIVISTQNAGISASIQSGSSLNIAGGVSGSFTGSSYINIFKNYITASGASVTNLYTQEFTGSLVGIFTGNADYVSGSISGSKLMFSASYFSGSIDGNDTETSGVISGSLVDGFIIGSVTSSMSLGLFSGVITSSVVTLSSGSVTGFYLDQTFLSFNGFLSCFGTSPNILGDPVFGNVTGMVTIASKQMTLPTDIVTTYATMPNEAPYAVGYLTFLSPYNQLMNSFYYWGGDQWFGAIATLPEVPYSCSCGTLYNVQAMFGTFTSGVFSGSHFVAYYNNYSILLASLSGSFGENALLGAHVNIPIPSGIDPYAYAYVNGVYVSGTALGTYVISGSNGSDATGSAGSNSASFNGQFINGELIGGFLNVQLSGSVYTSSFQYTSSVALSSSYLSSLDTTRPFSIALQNLKSEYKAGDIAKIGVFGRIQFPLKYFGKSTQQEQYLVPEFLPTSSFYALKDNQTEEIVMDFDNYTQIGCEYPQGNYFILDTTGLPQDRYYRVLIRVDDGQSIYTIDCGKTFKVTR